MSVGEAAPAVSSQGQAGRRWPVRPRVAVAAILAVLVVAAVAVAVWFLLLRHSAAIDKLVPQSADVLVVADLDPSISQKANLLSLSHKFPNLKNDQALSRRVDDGLNQAFKDAGLSFDRDIKPWLGSRLAVAATVGERTAGLVLVDSKDDARAKAALAKLRNSSSGKVLHWSDKTYQGQSLSVGTPGDGSQPAVYAYVDHTVLIGNDEAMVREAIDADRGAKGRLAESSGYKATLSLLPSDRLLLAYVDGGRIDQRVKDAIRRGTSGAQVPTASLNQIDAFRSLGFALAAHANGLAADLQLRLDPAKLDPTTRTALTQHTSLAHVLAHVPNTAYGFVATTAMRQIVQSIADQLGSSSPDAKTALQQLGLTGQGGALGYLSGPGAIELGPDPSSPAPGGALILSTDNLGSFDTFVRNTVAAAFQGGPLTSGGKVRVRNYDGIDVMTVDAPELSQMGYAPSWAVSPKLGTIGTTPDQVFAVIKAGNPQNSITTNAAYAAALREVDQNPDSALYLAIKNAAAALRGQLPADARAGYDKDVAPNLQPLRAFMLTSKTQSDRLSERFFLEIQ